MSSFEGESHDVNISDKVENEREMSIGQDKSDDVNSSDEGEYESERSQEQDESDNGQSNHREFRGRDFVERPYLPKDELQVIVRTPIKRYPGMRYIRKNVCRFLEDIVKKY